MSNIIQLKTFYCLQIRNITSKKIHIFNIKLLIDIDHEKKTSNFLFAALKRLAGGELCGSTDQGLMSLSLKSRTKVVYPCFKVVTTVLLKHMGLGRLIFLSVFIHKLYNV